MNAQQAAEDALLCQFEIARACERYYSDVLKRAQWEGCPESVTSLLLRQFPAQVRSSRIVLWTDEMFNLALGGEEQFVGTKTPTVTFPRSEFWSMGDHEFGVMTGAEGHVTNPPEGSRLGQFFLYSALFKGDTEAAHSLCGCYIFRIDNDDLPHLRFIPIPRDVPAAEVWCLFLAGRAFMDLKLAAQEPVLLPRATRRRMAREDKPIPDIRIVQLRQRESSDNHSGSREYHHKWIVQGHWRRLHEPRKEDGAEVTFVHAYVKGPEHAPLLQPRQSVYAVSR